jgi:hypothetical protein
MRSLSLILCTALFISGALVAQDVTTGLVAYYPLDGNADDASGNNNHGTVMGGAAPAPDRFGRAGNAFSFDGTDDYITVPNSATMQSPDSAVTLAAWVSLTAFDAGGFASIGVKPAAAVDGGQYGIQFESTGAFAIYLSDTAAFLESGLQFTLATWRFVAVTWDGDSVKLYIDGNSVASDSFKVTPRSNTSPFELGRDAPGAVELLNGSLDDVRLYNRALTATDIATLFADVTSVEQPQVVPATFELSQNFPNPFNPSTVIRYEIATSSRVVLRVLNLLGQEVRTLVNEQRPAGAFEVIWDGSNNLGQQVSSGAYLYRLEAADVVQTRKMLFLR